MKAPARHDTLTDESTVVEASEVSEREMFERAGFEHHDAHGSSRPPTTVQKEFRAQLVLGDTTWEGIIVDGIISWRETESKKS